MKTIKSILAVMLVLVAFATVSAQKMQTVTILTSAQCDMCEEKLEKNIAFEKGVSSVDLDVQSKKLTVTFNSNKTNVESLRKAVTMLGYDADGMVANSEAYSKLPDCCKKPVKSSNSGAKSSGGCGSKRPCSHSCGGSGK